MKKYIIISVVILVLAGVLGGVAMRRSSRNAKSKPAGAVVRVEVPQVSDLVESVNAPGEVEPCNKVAISARVAARIVGMPFEEGQRVTRGDPKASPPVPPSVLVRLDSTDLEAALRSTEARRAAQAAQIEAEKARIASQRAQIQATEATMLKAEQDLRRNEQLLKGSNLSQEDYDQVRCRHDELKAQREAAKHSLVAAERNLEVMQHNLEAAEADITRARDAMNYTTILAPIDGIVTRRNAKVGELAMTGTMNNPGTVIMEVADLSQMLVTVQLDERAVAKVETGQHATVRIHAYPGEAFDGVVTTIALTNDTAAGGVKYYKTRILLDTKGKRIYSGLTAEAEIRTKTHTGILKIPSQAIVGRPVDGLPLALRENNPNVDTKKTVTTVVYRFQGGKAVITPVSIGPSDVTHTILTAGASATDRIVTGPYKALDGLQDGQEIQDEREVAKKKTEKPAADAAKK